MFKRKVARFVRGHALARWLIGVGEMTVFGTRLRELILLGLLRGYYSSLSRRHWTWQVRGEPHFTLHRLGFFSLMMGTDPAGFRTHARAFYSATCVRAGDRVLDIGCGDGSLTRRALAPKASQVEAIDLEPSAVAYAARMNSGPNIHYAVLDAVTQPLPGFYDVICFDGALGHISAEDSAVLLAKIEAALKPEGIFCGSESLGHDGEDHLQFFETADDMRALLTTHFTHVRLLTADYPMMRGGSARVEAYWRCSQSAQALQALSWT